MIRIPFLSTALMTALAAAAPVAADEARRFNLDCREFENPDTLRDRIDHRFSIDLDRMEVCRQGHTQCWTVIDHGRWLELSYDFHDGEQPWVMFRLYDRQTGWLDQVIRPQGEYGRNYGDAICEVRPFNSLGPDR